MPPLARLTPSQVLHLWNSQPRINHHSRLISFANELIRAVQTGSVPAPVQATPLSELGLPTGTYNALRRAGFSFVEEIEALPPRELLLVNLIGATSIDYIQDALRRWKPGRRVDEPAPSPPAEPPAPVAATGVDLDELIDAFYAWTSDRERMAALLLRAADKIGAQGPEDLRVMAMGLLDRDKQEAA
jgi:hypothetical protein